MPILGIIASSKLGAPTSPVAGYYAWYDAADTATISLSGSKVTQWNDKSANLQHLTQGVDSQRPTSGTRTINSKNCLDFTGVTQQLVASTAANWSFMNNATGATIFFVSRLDTIAVRNFFFNTGYNPEAGNTAVYFSSLIDGKIDHLVGRSVFDSTSVKNRPAAAVYAANTNFYLTLISDQNNATAAERSRVSVSAGAENKANTSTAAVGTAAPPDPFSIGAYEITGPGPGYFEALDGLIGEFIIYQGILSAGNIAANKSYLAAKWAI